MAAMERKMMAEFNKVHKELFQLKLDKEILPDDRLLDNGHLTALLGVTKRTLAEYRRKGILPYYMNESKGKCYYTVSEVREFIKSMGLDIEV